MAALPDPRLVELRRAAVEIDNFAGCIAGWAVLRPPGSEALGAEGREVRLAGDAERPLHQPAGKAVGDHEVGDGPDGLGQAAEQLGACDQVIAEAADEGHLPLLTSTARARAFISAIFTPVGQTMLQTRQPLQ